MYPCDLTPRTNQLRTQRAKDKPLLRKQDRSFEKSCKPWFSKACGNTLNHLFFSFFLKAQRSREANSSGGRQEQCPLGSEVEVGGEATSGDSSGRRVVVMVPVVGGLGASAARTSCRSRSTTPLFLNTQHDADVLHRLLKDCVKTGKLGSVWVPVRRHAQHKKVNRPLVETSVTSLGNVEYDWMSAQYNRSTDDITLLPFPEKVNQRKGIICVKKKVEE
ncbi:uncharacterized protein [Procambarus clarkii]|uniref:uncharacterized protein n=1 Tax=Procambarus clarkii TaxID=6728 RepID=UPI003743A438